MQYVRTASEEPEQKLIKQGRLNAFVCEQSPVKADWDAPQKEHSKAMVCSLHLGVGQKMTAEETSAFRHVLYTFALEQVYLHIHKFHAAKLEDYLKSGRLEENLSSVGSS